MAGTLVCLSGLAGMDCSELICVVRNAVVPVVIELTEYSCKFCVIVEQDD